MAKFVPDIKTQRWIVISQTRWHRPDEHVGGTRLHPPAEKHACVFCPGSEHLATNEILRTGDGGKDESGWKIRVIPNKFPITDIHEVIIHDPDHHRDLPDTDPRDVAALLGVYKSRFIAHKKDGQVMIFCNHGEHAGASLTHPHSQLVVLPRQINLDSLVREPVINLVEDHAHFVTYCPDFSQWPYEVWIAAKTEGTTYDQITEIEIADLALVMQKALRRLRKKYEALSKTNLHMNGGFSYNYYIHHADNWFIRIIPRLVHRAGFELGTGLSVNVVDPTVAAEELRRILDP